MRLHHFINERTTRYEVINKPPEEMVNIINTECKKYLKETKGNWFQRGIDISSFEDGQVGYLTVRNDRRPSGMGKNTANELNRWLVKNKHSDRSKSVMCSRDANSLFGNPFTIFIQGDYKYTWADTQDLNMDYEATFWYGSIVEDFIELVIKNNEDYHPWGPSHLRLIRNKERKEVLNLGAPYDTDDLNEKHYKRVKDWLEKSFPLMFHSNRQLNMAYTNNAETWFQCKGYYFFNSNDRNLLTLFKRELK